MQVWQVEITKSANVCSSDMVSSVFLIPRIKLAVVNHKQVLTEGLFKNDENES